jgi:oxygen-independent coproporphyrinogen-3 oxidase
MISTYPFKYSYTPSGQFLELEKAALYIHVPFCLHKCDYCTYVSVVGSSEDQREEYVRALCEEIGRFPDIKCYPRFKIDALYFGGGTPSILSTRQLARLVDRCRETFEFLPSAELCMEFDPSTVTKENLEFVKEYHFDRISFGVQAFNDAILQACNRSHSAAQAYSAIRLAKELKIENFNIDLMYPLPNMSMQALEETLTEAIGLGPAAITAHVLEVWPGTRFARLIKEKGYQLPSYDEELSMTTRAYDLLEANGYKRWSTCGYYDPTRTKEYCRFMDYYWKTLPMIGFGVSAKTLLGQRAYTNVSSMPAYVNRIRAGESPLDFSVVMSKRQEMLRVIIRGLKVCAVDKQHFMDRFGVSMDVLFSQELKYLVDRGWLVDNEERIELTRSVPMTLSEAVACHCCPTSAHTACRNNGDCHS